MWRTKESKSPAPKEQNYKHEIACNDVYIALRKLGIPLVWVPEDDQKNGLRFDRAAQIFGKHFFFEIERGTQTLQTIEEKVEAYMKLPGRFHVVFTVQDYRPNPFEPVVKTALDFGGEILTYLATVNRGSQFVVVPHNLFINEPLGSYLITPRNQQFSLETIQ